jgi:hypothetical protein
MAISGLLLRVTFSLCCGMSYLFYGYDQGFMSGVLLADDFLSTMGHPSTLMQSTITSIYEIGCLIGKFCHHVAGLTPCLGLRGGQVVS